VENVPTPSGSTACCWSEEPTSIPPRMAPHASPRRMNQTRRVTASKRPLTGAGPRPSVLAICRGINCSMSRWEVRWQHLEGHRFRGSRRFTGSRSHPAADWNRLGSDDYGVIHATINAWTKSRRLVVTARAGQRWKAGVARGVCAGGAVASGGAHERTDAKIFRSGMR
jgi:hypothetical protein